jgi:hypothetical protein
MTDSVCDLEPGVSRCNECRYWTGAECGYRPYAITRPDAGDTDRTPPYSIFDLAVFGAVIL